MSPLEVSATAKRAMEEINEAIQQNTDYSLKPRAGSGFPRRSVSSRIKLRWKLAFAFLVFRATASNQAAVAEPGSLFYLCAVYITKKTFCGHIKQRPEPRPGIW